MTDRYTPQEDVVHLRRRVDYLEKKLEEAKMDWLDQAAVGICSSLRGSEAYAMWHGADIDADLAKSAYTQAEALWNERQRRQGHVE